jgi:hypothetical protein
MACFQLETATSYCVGSRRHLGAGRKGCCRCTTIHLDPNHGSTALNQPSPAFPALVRLLDVASTQSEIDRLSRIKIDRLSRIKIDRLSPIGASPRPSVGLLELWKLQGCINIKPYRWATSRNDWSLWSHGNKQSSACFRLPNEPSSATISSPAPDAARSNRYRTQG